jgi:hypothetical protein
MLTIKSATPYAFAQFLTVFRAGEDVTAEFAPLLVATYQEKPDALGQVTLEAFLKGCAQKGLIDSWDYPSVNFALYSLSLADFVSLVKRTAACMVATDKGLVGKP